MAVALEVLYWTMTGRHRFMSTQEQLTATSGYLFFEGEKQEKMCLKRRNVLVLGQEQVLSTC